MYIACPECNTKFVVTAAQIGEHGRRVKCSKCSHIWHQTMDSGVSADDLLLPPAMNFAATAAPAGHGVNLPALVQDRVPAYFYMIPTLLLGLILMMFAMIFPDKLGINSILQNSQISIKDLQITKDTALNKITINYKVHNASNNTTHMPLVRVRLFDSSGRVIKSRVDDHSKINMSAGQFIQIKTEFAPVPESADSIDVMLGNKVDFIIR